MAMILDEQLRCCSIPTVEQAVSMWNLPGDKLDVLIQNVYLYDRTGHDYGAATVRRAIKRLVRRGTAEWVRPGIYRLKDFR